MLGNRFLVTNLKRISYFILIVFLTPILWIATSKLIMADKGIDLTDEGLYILGAANASSAFGTPWNWHIAPLFNLVNKDIADFRTLGAMLIFLSSFSVGAIIFLEPLHLQKKFSKIKIVKSIAVGALLALFSSFYFYSGMQRAPGYNWLAILGLLVTCNGFLLTLTVSYARMLDAEPRNLLCLISKVMTGLGLLVSLPARPALPLLLIALMFLVYLRTFGFTSTRKWFISAFKVYTIMVVIAIFIGLWPVSFLNNFIEGFNLPAFIYNQTPIGALIYLAKTPDIFLGEIVSLSVMTKLVLWIAVFIVLFSLLWKTTQAILLLGLTIWCFGVSLLVGWPWVNSADSINLGAASSILTTGSILLSIGILAYTRLSILNQSAEHLVKKNSNKVQNKYQATKSSPNPNSFNNNIHGRECDKLSASYRLAKAKLTFLAIAPFLPGFGASAGIYRQAGLTAGLIVIASLHFFNASLKKFELRQMTSVYFLIGAVIINYSLAAKISGERSPFAQESLVEATYRLSMPGESGGYLYVSPAVGSELDLLKSTATKNGWKSNSKLLDVTWCWHPFIPYFLSAQTPKTLILGTTCDPGSLAALKYTLSNAYSSGFTEGSWLLLSTESAVKRANADEEYSTVKSTLEIIIKKRVESDYIKIAETENYILFAPK